MNIDTKKKWTLEHERVHKDFQKFVDRYGHGAIAKTSRQAGISDTLLSEFQKHRRPIGPKTLGMLRMFLDGVNEIVKEVREKPPVYNEPIHQRTFQNDSDHSVVLLGICPRCARTSAWFINGIEHLYCGRCGHFRGWSCSKCQQPNSSDATVCTRCHGEKR